jgi:transcriptional regulator with XRE-family HTH domain
MSPHPIVSLLRAARRDQRLRIDVLGEMLGYHWVTISRWERGLVSPPLQALQDWSQALGVKLTIEASVPAREICGDWDRVQTRYVISARLTNVN